MSCAGSLRPIDHWSSYSYDFVADPGVVLEDAMDGGLIRSDASFIFA